MVTLLYVFNGLFTVESSCSTLACRTSFTSGSCCFKPIAVSCYRRAVLVISPHTLSTLQEKIVKGNRATNRLYFAGLYGVGTLFGIVGQSRRRPGLVRLYGAFSDGFGIGAIINQACRKVVSVKAHLVMVLI